jgi:uncharacterized protein (TIGR00661 family)
MRIAYGVHGYSRGHATRALSVLTELAKRHEVLVFAGGDAAELLGEQFPVEPVPVLAFHYGRRGQRSNSETIRRNLPLGYDLLGGGRYVGRVRRALRAFDPTLVICDAEAWTARAARDLGIPRVSFDHFGILVHCKVELTPGDLVKSALDRALYRWLMGDADYVLVSSFYDAAPRSPRVKVIPPLLRDDVKQVQPRDGGHLLVYMNRGADLLTDNLMSSLRRTGCEVRFYGAGARPAIGNIAFRPTSNRPFLDDLASCRAVISTAGNQLVGEALYYGKPMLVMPERCVEQRLNAGGVVRMGIGERADIETLTVETIESFLEATPLYAARARRATRDGRDQAIACLEGWMRKHAPTPAVKIDVAA